MCTELLLAIIYFSIILVINYFLGKLLIIYINNIYYLLKIQNLLKFSKTLSYKLITLLYSYSKKELKNQYLLSNLRNISNNKDVLIIGNIYKYILSNLKNSNEFDLYYFKLLETQYLSINK